MSGATDKRLARAQRVLSPGRRLARVAVAAAVVSVALHVGLPPLIRPVGERLFPVPFGGFAFLALGIAVGLVAVAVVMAALCVPLVDVVAIWPIGSTLAVMYGLLGIKALSLVGGDWTGPGVTVAYVTVDTAAAVLGFVLAAVVAEWRFALRLRLGLPLAALGVTAAMWVTVYLIRYGT